MKKKGIFFAVSSALIFGIAPVFAGVSYKYGNTPMNMSLIRNIFVLPILLIFILCFHLSLKMTKTQALHMVWISIIGSIITSLCLYQAYAMIGVGTTTTIHFIYPFLVCLGSRMIFKKKLGLNKYFSLMICLIGVLFFVEASNQNLKGICFAFTSAISYAFYMLFLEKWKLTEIHPIVFSFYLSLIASILLLLVNQLYPYLIIDLPLKAYGNMLVAAIGTSIIASIFLNKSVVIIGAAEASICSFLEPLSSVIAGVVLLSELITWQKIMGCFLIVGAVMMAIMDGKREEI